MSGGSGRTPRAARARASAISGSLDPVEGSREGPADTAPCEELYKPRVYSHHDRSGEATVGPVSLQGGGIVDGVSSVAKLLLQRIQADSPPSRSIGLEHSKWFHGLLKRHLKPRGNSHRRAAPEGACDPARPQAVASSSHVTADKLAAVVASGLSVRQAVALGFLPRWVVSRSDGG